MTLKATEARAERGLHIPLAVEGQVATAFNQGLVILAPQGQTTHSGAATEAVVAEVARMGLEVQAVTADSQVGEAAAAVAMTAQEMEA
jgi:hypothetical protein|tara:strand:- start:650 stop:913 length:264 start_codon:yes stop_codon:yes gene_type:complete